MTELEQRIALAELQGLRGIWLPVSLAHGTFINSHGEYLPELTLDWLHELEADEQVKGVKFHLMYPEELRKLCGQGIEYFATARQRSEALLRTLNLWRE